MYSVFWRKGHILLELRASAGHSCAPARQTLVLVRRPQGSRGQRVMPLLHRAHWWVALWFPLRASVLSEGNSHKHSLLCLSGCRGHWSVPHAR